MQSHVDVLDAIREHVVKGILFVQDSHHRKGVSQIGRNLFLYFLQSHHSVFVSDSAIVSAQFDQKQQRKLFDPAEFSGGIERIQGSNVGLAETCTIFLLDYNRRRHVKAGKGPSFRWNICVELVPKELGDNPRPRIPHHGDSMHWHAGIKGRIICGRRKDLAKGTICILGQGPAASFVSRIQFEFCGRAIIKRLVHVFISFGTPTTSLKILLGFDVSSFNLVVVHGRDSELGSSSFSVIQQPFPKGFQEFCVGSFKL
mmetsp:Transcript_13492/g.33924  ORF Transcript_13492/g.33924 Transcript_13492/m.33924 type:complete len:257 (+) Transcript_13492:287-1057(+)